MAQAPRDQNLVTTLLGVSNADGTTPVTIYVDPSTHRVLVSSSGGAVAGSDTQVIFNDAGAYAGDAGLTYNKTTDTLTVVGPIIGTGGTTISGGTANINLIGQTTNINTGAGFGNVNIGGTDRSNNVTINGLQINLNKETTGGGTINIMGHNNTDTDVFSFATGAGTGNVGVSVMTKTGSGTYTLSLGTGNAAKAITLGNSNAGTTLDILSGTAGVKVTSVLSPAANDGTPLGTTALQWSDLFLAEGGVINWDNGDATLTQVGDVVTLAGADLKVSSPGNVATSVITTDATQTLTNKTLTSPTLTTPSAFTTGGTITLAENTSIALDPAGSADGKYTGLTITGVAGEALVFGDVIVLDVTAGKWFKGSVSAAAGADGDLRGGTGMCVLAAAGDASATNILLNGTCRADANFPALTIGSVVYATTSGDITVTRPSTTDHVIKVLGFALTADEILFNPSMDYITNI